MATFAVVVLSPIFLKLLAKVPEVLKEGLAVTIAAQILTLPIIAYHFGQVSLIGIMANLLVLWTILVVMMGGIVSLVLGLLNTTLGQIVGLLPSILITYFLDVVKLLASLPFSMFKIQEGVCYFGWVTI